MTPRLVAARAQVRHLNAAQLFADAVMTSVGGMLSMVVLLLASQVGFDALAFEGHLFYAGRIPVEAASARPDAPTITTVSGVNVLSTGQFDAEGRADGDLIGSAQPTVWVYPSAATTDLAVLLGANLLDGRPRPRQAALDEATAAALGIRVGDDLVVAADGRSCRIGVSAITRPFRDIDVGLASGLLVLADDTCDEVTGPMTATSTSAVRYWTTPGGEERPGKEERISHVLLALSDVEFTGLLLPVALISLGLWLLVSLQGARRVRAQLAPVDDLLLDLGCRSARLRSTPLLVTASMTALSALGAAAAVRQLLWQVAGIYIQTPHWLATALGFAAAAIVAAAISTARDHRRAALQSPATPTQGAR
ncbi:hypothetical protein [Microbacterium sp. T2.11-28]|uniref:hypothetical protein n=1 Tax=Microbacterium sp. T2.11-28 TaxID=3041169 RepID=UPI0024773CE2|nr:hypothetical protein [Microbacterium sp. T2.11-28]CAI9389954.1 hypothetical protein MICABA_01286 [Microbacterium sp. T2.11-28]